MSAHPPPPPPPFLFQMFFRSAVADQRPLTKAAVDVETDAMLQTTLRSAMFKHRTIVTIAHRINTILDSDRIVVLDRGAVAEFDSPAALVRQRGLFYELVREAGLLGSVGEG